MGCGQSKADNSIKPAAQAHAEKAAKAQKAE